jgi:hypothetical protein
MTIDEQIAEYLKANAGVTALVGTDVWLCLLPQGLKKGVAYQQISGPKDPTYDGREKTNARWQFTSYADDRRHELARSIHDAVVDAIEFMRGELVTNGIFVESDVLEDERGPMFDYERALHRRERRHHSDVLATRPKS